MPPKINKPETKDKNQLTIDQLYFLKLFFNKESILILIDQVIKAYIHSKLLTAGDKQSFNRSIGRVIVNESKVMNAKNRMESLRKSLTEILNTTISVSIDDKSGAARKLKLGRLASTLRTASNGQMGFISFTNPDLIFNFLNQLLSQIRSETEAYREISKIFSNSEYDYKKYRTTLNESQTNDLITIIERINNEPQEQNTNPDQDINLEIIILLLQIHLLLFTNESIILDPETTQQIRNLLNSPFEEA